MKAILLAARTQLAKAANLLYGTKALGLYEEVTDAKFITPAALTTAVALTTGTVQNTVSGWFKFSYKGKTLYISKLPLRYNVYHSDLDSRGILTGSKLVTIGGQRYRVRVPQGLAGNTFGSLANGTTTDDPLTQTGNEFSDLLYRVSADGGFTGVNAWLKYVLTALGFSTGYANGSGTICMEKASSTYQLFRGFAGLKSAHKGDLSGVPPCKGWRPVLELVSPALLKGEVAQADLITQTALAAAVGMTSIGTAIAANASDPWLKIVQDGITKYVAKRPLRQNVSWSQLNALGLVTGTKTVVIGGKTYRVRLLKGVGVNGTSVLPVAAVGHDIQSTWYSEWNTVMYHLYSGVSSNNVTMTSEGITVGDQAQYTDAQLAIGSGQAGSTCWCQELFTDGSGVTRGGAGIGNILYAAAGTAGYGWRPVLELVE